MSGPRVAPLRDEEMTAEAREALQPFVRPDGIVHNVFRTVARHPQALRRWTPFVRHVLNSSLAQRETELLILRVAAVRNCAYAWAQHVRIARRAGLTDRQILAVRDGPDAASWGEREADLLLAADDLLRDANISDAVWRRLAGRYSQPQLIDIVLTVGQYNLACMVLNTCGAEIDTDLNGDPPLDDG